MAIHASATTARPSRAKRDVLRGRRKLISPPSSTNSAMGSKNGAGDSPQSSATASGITSRAASVSRMRPMTKAIIRLFTGLAFLY